VLLDIHQTRSTSILQLKNSDERKKRLYLLSMGCLKMDISDQYFTALKVVKETSENVENTRAGSYRFGFNGMEKEDEITGVTGSHLSFSYRILDTRIGRFLSVDPLSSSYPWNSTYAFAMNRVIDGIDLEGLEYLDADVARIKMRGGIAHINLENFNNVTRNAWKRRGEAGNWPAGNIGFPTAVGQLTHPSLPATSESASLDNTYGAVDPAHNPMQQQVQKPIAQSTGLPDKRLKDRTITSGSPGMAKGAAGLVMAVNAINWALETYGSFQMAEDRELVSEHMSILKNQVAADLTRALELNMIPEQYQNLQDMGNIANVVLSGVNSTDNQEIYDIGINIVKEISGNYRQKYEIIYPEAQEGQDRTAPKPIIVPIIEK